MDTVYHNPDKPMPIPIKTPEITSPVVLGLLAHPPRNTPKIMNMIKRSTRNGTLAGKNVFIGTTPYLLFEAYVHYGSLDMK